MHGFYRSTPKRCALFVLTCLISFSAWGQSQAPRMQHQVLPSHQVLTNIVESPKVLNFAERQYLNTSNPSDYRDKYAVSCLIYSYYRHLINIEITIFSTYKVNRCNPASFLKNNASSVKAQLLNRIKSDYVILAGPHIQMMDFNNTPVENLFTPVGELNFSPIARAHLGIKDVFLHFREWGKWINSLQYYTPIKTVQDMDFTWYPNSTVYKLISDQNEVYLLTNMVSNDYILRSEDVDEAAKNLGKYLNLPAGWRFEMSVLDKVLQVKQRQFDGNPTFHMQDEFGNLYVRVPGLK